jgi:hypothetical protein
MREGIQVSSVPFSLAIIGVLKLYHMLISFSLPKMGIRIYVYMFLNLLLTDFS